MYLSARETDWDGSLKRFAVDPAELLAGRRLNAMLWLHTLLLKDSAGRPVPPETLHAQAERVLTL